MVMTSTRSLALTVATCAIYTCNTQFDVDALKLTAKVEGQMHPLGFGSMFSFRGGYNKANKAATSASGKVVDLKDVKDIDFNEKFTPVNTIPIIADPVCTDASSTIGRFDLDLEIFFRSIENINQIDFEKLADVFMKYMIETQLVLSTHILLKYKSAQGQFVDLSYTEYFDYRRWGDNSTVRTIMREHEEPKVKTVRVIRNKDDANSFLSAEVKEYELIKGKQSYNLIILQKGNDAEGKQYDLIEEIAFQQIFRYFLFHFAPKLSIIQGKLNDHSFLLKNLISSLNIIRDFEEKAPEEGEEPMPRSTELFRI